MKKTIITSLLASVTLLSSCNTLSLFTPVDNAVVQTDTGFEVYAHSVTMLSVSAALAKNPSTYEDFLKVEQALRLITAEGTIDADMIKAQINNAIMESSSKNKLIVASAFNLVLTYFENKYKVSLDNQQAYETVVAIADGINEVLELHTLSNGEVTKELKK